MADVIVSSVLIRLRHPVHEAGLLSTFDATIQEWVINASGVPKPLTEEGPFTPQQLEARGVSLPALMDVTTQAAIRDRAEAIARAEAAERALLQANERLAETSQLLKKAENLAVMAIKQRDAALNPKT